MLTKPSLYPLAQPDGGTGSSLDDSCQKFIGWGLLGFVFQADVTMLEFFLAEPLDCLSEIFLGGFVCQFFGLLGVVLVDNLLYRHGAGHGGTLTHERRRRTKGKTREVPDRLQEGGADAALRQHFVKMPQMLEFLFQHVLQEGALVGSPHDCELTFIDAARAILAGMIDAEQLGHALLPIQIAWTVGAGARLLWCARVLVLHADLQKRPPTEPSVTTARPRDSRKLYPAIDIPRNDQGTSSQRTTGVASSAARNWPISRLSKAGAEQPEAHQPCSTPM